MDDHSKSPKINDMPSSERPRERLLNNGASSLSTTELIAILLRTGTEAENVIRLAERVLSHFGGLHGLAKTTSGEMMKIKGLGAAKTTQILAALEIGNRLAATTLDDRMTIRNANDAAKLVMDMRYLHQEHVRLILLDNHSRVINIPTVYIGTLDTTVLRVSELFRESITRNSPALILAHNHPGGTPQPSTEDIEFTRNLVKAGQLLDIQIIDHIIIGEQDWLSLREIGAGF